VKYAWIEEHVQQFSVSQMCRVLTVSSSGYYEWRDRAPSVGAVKHEALQAHVKKVYEESHGIYGHRKVHQELIDEYKATCCVETVRGIMKQKGLRSTTARKFVVTTDSGHAMPIAENILDRDFNPERPNEKWVADITYIRTYEGWSYLAAVMDLYGRRIVGWAMSKRIDAQLVADALNNAVRARSPAPGLMHHSDRGVQYASSHFQGLLKTQQIKCSMGRKGNCWDNACIERFFKSLKGEWIGDTIYISHEAANAAVFGYIEMFYNTKRRHAALGYKSPRQFEKQALTLNKKAA
jgi:putative transposase